LNKKTEIFTQTAESYDEWYYHPQGKQIFEAELNVVNSLIPDEGTGLEVGSGTGIFAERLSRDGRIIICLDPSKGMMLK